MGQSIWRFLELLESRPIFWIKFFGFVGKSSESCKGPLWSRLNLGCCPANVKSPYAFAAFLVLIWSNIKCQIMSNQKYRYKLIFYTLLILTIYFTSVLHLWLFFCFCNMYYQVQTCRFHVQNITVSSKTPHHFHPGSANSGVWWRPVFGEAISNRLQQETWNKWYCISHYMSTQAL